jgi:hypothetical protein
MAACCHSRIVIADVDAAERVAIELLRNVLVARPDANVLAVGIETWTRLRSFLLEVTSRYGARSDRARGHWDVCIVAGDCQSLMVENVHMVIALPLTLHAISAERQVKLDLGTPRGVVIVVPGTARLTNGAHALTAETFGRLRRAEKIAKRRPVRALILSGWNGRIESSRSEAAQMLDAWRGPQVPIILDEAARTTAENALWAASLVNALGNVRRVEVTTAWIGFLRLGLATLFAFRKTKIRPRFSVVWGAAQAASWRPALVGMVHLRRHLRIGREFISGGPRDLEV